jgi:hypothetical protein|tara:strand:+ start:384 stop:1202 length:819 start_codon:yes stop_codon:yes gene_type:complete
MSIGRLLKKIAPIAVGSFFGPAALGSTGLSPFFQRAVTGALASKIGGAKTKDALVAGALSGGLGALFGGAEAGPGSQATKDAAIKAGTSGGSKALKYNVNPDIDKKMGISAGSKVGTDVASEGIKKVVTGDSASPSFLNMLGIGDDSLTGKFLSSGIGQGLTAGLLMQLLAGGEDEGDMRSEFERRPFGTGGPGGKLGGITYANLGGAMNFPRRDGGIDPSEGSGTKDDVPAMLTAGEFVLTKDAVKGLGGGNQRRGIERAYDMMNKLEARA